MRNIFSTFGYFVEWRFLLQLHVNFVEIFSVLAVCLSYLRAVPRGAAHEKGPLSTFCHGSFNRVLELQLLVPLAYWRCFLFLRVGLPAQECLYLMTCEIKLFVCCGRSMGEQCCIMEERGKTLRVTQCHYFFLVCKWQWDISAAIFNFHLSFLLIQVWVAGDYVTQSCVTKVSLFIYLFFTLPNQQHIQKKSYFISGNKLVNDQWSG